MRYFILTNELRIDNNDIIICLIGTCLRNCYFYRVTIIHNYLIFTKLHFLYLKGLYDLQIKITCGIRSKKSLPGLENKVFISFFF